MKCPDCEDGLIKHPCPGVGDLNGWFEMCPTCKGTGEVPDPKAMMATFDKNVDDALERLVDKGLVKVENPDPKGREDEVIYKALEDLHDRHEGKGVVKRYMVEQGRYMVEMVEAEEYDRLQEQIEQIPPGTMYSANRYDTDDRMKLHVWDGNGNSYDIDLPKSETCGNREG